jgi:hypothetical protein
MCFVESPRLALVLLAASLAVGACGCGSSTNASGQVTYEGVPVKEGYITFFPADEKGPMSAAQITDGSYQLTMSPGRHLVEITAAKKIQFALSSEEMEAKFKAAKSKGNASGIVESADLIPANAVGNRQTIDVKSGTQTLDFHLKKP